MKRMRLKNLPGTQYELYRYLPNGQVKQLLGVFLKQVEQVT